MAKFYQPAETQGVYEHGPNRLTVNQGDRAFIGFRAVSPKELQDTTVDTSENVETARYSISSTSFELETNTGKPLTFLVTATQDVAMSATPKNMCKPLEVVIRRPSSELKTAVGQGKDLNGCWAACLSYFLTVASGRQARGFKDILMDFSGLWSADDTISPAALRKHFADHRPRYRVASENIVPNRLPAFVGRWPLLVGFSRNQGGHMNVLIACDPSKGTVTAMEPWLPECPDDFIDDSSIPMTWTSKGADFEFTGGIVTRPLSYYQSPVSSGFVFVAYPEEYRNRIP